MNKEPLELKKYGLIGYPLSHSFSRHYFTRKFVQENLDHVSYGLFPLKNEIELESFVTSRNYSGLNVTIPYKFAVIPFLDELAPEARAIGAINVIHNDQNHLKGYNTDCFGFYRALQSWQEVDLSGMRRALLLGTGGSAHSVKFALQQLGIEADFVSRNPEKASLTYESLEPGLLQTYQLIVNCTPLGTWPDVDTAPPIPYEGLDGQALFDLVYNPDKTRFLELGEARNCPTTNGMQMLIEQAEAAWDIWNGREVKPLDE